MYSFIIHVTCMIILAVALVVNKHELMSHFPKLSDGGGFELLRIIDGGGAKKLWIITVPDSGYDVLFLKAVSSTSGKGWVHISGVLVEHQKEQHANTEVDTVRRGYLFMKKFRLLHGVSLVDFSKLSFTSFVASDDTTFDNGPF